LLALIQYQWKITKVRVLCFREVPGKQDIGTSKFLTAQLSSYVPVTGMKIVGVIMISAAWIHGQRFF
jgi:hypothetical protein